MKIKIIKKFEVKPGKFLYPTDNTITVLDKVGYGAVKRGFALSIDKPEINPVKSETKTVTTKNKKEKK